MFMSRHGMMVVKRKPIINYARLTLHILQFS